MPFCWRWKFCSGIFVKRMTQSFICICGVMTLCLMILSRTELQKFTSVPLFCTETITHGHAHAHTYIQAKQTTTNKMVDRERTESIFTKQLASRVSHLVLGWKKIIVNLSDRKATKGDT